MGALKTSEQGDAVAGEGLQRATSADDRPVDTGAKIIISAGPIGAASTVAPAAPRAHRPSQAPIAEPRRGGLWLVLLLYVMSGGALAYAIYERFLAA